MAIDATDASASQSLAELRSIRRQAKFTNVMSAIGVGLLASTVHHEFIGPALYFVVISVVVCLLMH